MAMDKDFHKGHRERLRKRYLEGGAGALADHEILEMLLFYAIPRKDTKLLAHSLLEKFGTLDNVFDAPARSLSDSGLSENAACLIKLAGDVGERMAVGNVNGKRLTGYDEIGRYLVKEFAGDRVERLAMIMLDGKDRFMGSVTVGVGELRQSGIDTCKIAEEIVIRKPSKVIFAHNHPSGSVEISINDHAATSTLEMFLGQLGTELVEHYVIADEKYVGIKMHNERVKKAGEEVYLRSFGFNSDLQ